MKEGVKLIAMGILILWLAQMAKPSNADVIEWPGGPFHVRLIEGTPRLDIEAGAYNITWFDAKNIRLVVVTRIEGNLQIANVTLNEDERGNRIYPSFNLVITECPSRILVYRKEKNITDLIFASKALSLDMLPEGRCRLYFNGLNIYSIGYISGNDFMTLTLYKSPNAVLSYIIIGLGGTRYTEEPSSTKEASYTAQKATNSGGAIDGLTRTGPLEEPVKITGNNDSLFSGKMKYLIGLILSILMIVSLVYEYGRSRESN